MQAFPTLHLSVTAILCIPQFPMNFLHMGRAVTTDMHTANCSGHRVPNWSLASKCRGGGSHQAL